MASEMFGNNYEYRPVADLFHAYSNGSDTPSLHDSDKAFIYTMNQLPRYALRCGCSIWAFSLMHTHIHLILRGNAANCTDFCQSLSYAVNRNNLLGKQEALSFSLDPIKDEGEAMSKICYVLRNPLEASRSLLPWHYPWTSLNLYFAPLFARSGVPLSTFSARQRRAKLPNFDNVPLEWRISEQGYILPDNYVDFESVNRLFASPLRFLAFFHMTRRDIEKMKATLGGRRLAHLNDQELRDESSRLSRSLFGKEPRSLLASDRLLLAGKLRERFHPTYRQLSRILRLPKDVIEPDV